MYASLSFQALGGPNTVTWLSLSNDDRIKEKIIGEVHRIQSKFSRYEATSIVSQINATAGKGSIQVDEETAGLLNFAAEIWRASSGLFDVTSGILRKVWKFSENSLPTKAEVNELLPLIGWDRVLWESPSVTLKHVGMEIDFGGIGKEYAADRVRSILFEAGVSSALINLGGDVCCLGAGPEGRPWRIGIKHPRKDNTALLALGLSDAALATSGDYERCMLVNGRRYCHILNPKTGFPDVTAASVSVVSESCLVSGSLSTSAMLLSPTERAKFLTKLQVSAVVLDESGHIAERYGALEVLPASSSTAD